MKRLGWTALVLIGMSPATARAGWGFSFHHHAPQHHHFHYAPPPCYGPYGGYVDHHHHPAPPPCYHRPWYGPPRAAFWFGF
jgi:hypothetical protein